MDKVRVFGPFRSDADVVAELVELSDQLEYERRANISMAKANRALADEARELIIENSRLRRELNDCRIAAHMGGSVH